jgi:hypothetical protein
MKSCEACHTIAVQKCELADLIKNRDSLHTLWSNRSQAIHYLKVHEQTVEETKLRHLYRDVKKLDNAIDHLSYQIHIDELSHKHLESIPLIKLHRRSVSVDIC